VDRFIDISATINSHLVLWPGHPAIESRRMRDMDKGDDCNVSICSFCAHVGTHVDSPKHFFLDGEGVESIPTDGLIGRAFVADLTHVEKGISKDDLLFLRKRKDFDILLMKTRNSTQKRTWDQFDPTYIYLEPDGAEFILECGMKGIVIDCLGINEFEDARQSTHKILLRENRIAVIEGVDLRYVEPGSYFFICLPIKLEGSDGAPARAILIRPEEFRAWGGIA